MIKKLDKIKKIGLETKKFLEKGDFESFANIMNQHWFGNGFTNCHARIKT